MKRVLAFLFIILTASYVHAGAEVAAPELTKIEVSDSECEIEWTYPPGSASFNIYMESIEGKFVRLNGEPVTEPRVKLESLINGMPYRFAITSVDENGRESEAAETGMVVAVGHAYKKLSFEGGKSAADYHIFSTPFVTGRTRPEEIFAYFPKYDNSIWRLFSLDRSGYSEFGDIKSIVPGKAYWFLSNSDSELFLSGKTVDNYEEFKVNLHPGWNIIASPFMYPVDWEEALIHNPRLEQFIGRDLWGFSDGGFERVITMRPFEGYYVYNGFGGDVELLIPPVPSKPKVAEEISAIGGSGVSLASREQGWRIKISANDGTYRDDDNYFGIYQKADDGQDRMDAPEPPAWPQHLSLYFVGNEGDKKSADMRKFASRWTALVEGGEKSEVSLEWIIPEAAPGLILTDTTLNKTVEMGKSGSYSFTRTSTAPRKFVISLK